MLRILAKEIHTQMRNSGVVTIIKRGPSSLLTFKLVIPEIQHWLILIILSHDISCYNLNICFSGGEIMAYFMNYWKFNEIRKYNHKHSNVSQQKVAEEILLFSLIVFTRCAGRQTLFFRNRYLFFWGTMLLYFTRYFLSNICTSYSTGRKYHHRKFRR